MKSNLITGIALIVFGAVFILGNLDFLELGKIWRFWPFVLVAIGVPKLLQYPSPKEFCEGIWLVFLGLWLYSSNEHLFGIGFTRSWPLILVVAGACMIIKNVLQNANRRTVEESYGQ